jgi:hypothetical protein
LNFFIAILYIDYRCEDRKRFGDRRGDIVAIKQVLTRLLRKLRLSLPKKQNVQPGILNAFKDTCFKPGFEFVSFKAGLTVSALIPSSHT